MTRRVVHRLLAIALLLALASTPAGASGTRPPAALTASPARVALVGSGRAVVQVTNAGTERALVDVRRAGFALDLRGRPKIVAAQGAARSALGWLTLRPATLALPPGATRTVTIVSRPPPRAEPGDHDALVLLATRRRASGRVAVRIRLGVHVVVRVPGPVVHRLELRRLRAVAGRRVRAIEAVVANRGNVTESFPRRSSVLSLHRGGRRLARLDADPRYLRPGTVGVLRFRYRGPRLSGPVVARLDVRAESGRVLRRTVRLRL